jgi:uncharacterized protein
MTAVAQLDVQTLAYLPRIVDIVRRALEGVPCSVWLFGSRATGRGTAVSDFDLAVRAEASVSKALADAREDLEESTIPFLVDLVDLREASAALIDQVNTKGILLWSR